MSPVLIGPLTWGLLAVADRQRRQRPVRLLQRSTNRVTLPKGRKAKSTPNPVVADIAHARLGAINRSSHMAVLSNAHATRLFKAGNTVMVWHLGDALGKRIRTWEAAGLGGALRRADCGVRPVLCADAAGRLALLRAGPVGCLTLAPAGVLSCAWSAGSISSASPSSPPGSISQPALPS